VLVLGKNGVSARTLATEIKAYPTKKTAENRLLAT
jgi:hypothetical protein